MDLMGGYGSSSDDEAVSAPAPEQQKQEASTSGNKKGRKILSLASVLPRNILDKLTKGDMDDSEDEGDVPVTTAPKGERTEAQRQGLNNLLSDLSKQAPTASLKSSTTGRTTQSEQLGLAFLQSTVSVERKSKSAAVRDIHIDAVEEEPSQNPFNGKSAKKSAAVTEPNVHKTLSSSMYSLPKRNMRVSAAPKTSMLKPPPPPAPIAPAAQNRTAAEGTEIDIPNNRKRSRKEMERALRQGNMSAVEDADFSVSLQQANPDAYTPEPETYAVPQHGIRVVSTAMYDPSAGQAVHGTSGKGRGKNQIHHLMASAADLELQRARGLAKNPGKAHRANARQKYGW